MSCGDVVLVASGFAFNVGCSIEGANARQKDAEAGDIAACAAKRAVCDAALVFLHDASADPETEPRALGGFGTEEGLEELTRIFRLNADASINN